MYVLKQTKRDTFLDIVGKLENRKRILLGEDILDGEKFGSKSKNSDKSLDLNKTRL